MSPSVVHQVLRRKPNHIPHIGIIGAGVTGLKCAEILLEKGVRVTILEGRDRIGGRVQQSDQLGHIVDLGANWIHGANHNPILDLAKETGSIAVDTGEAGCAYDENGKLLDDERTEMLNGVFWGTVADAFKYSNESSDIPTTKSLKNYFIDKLHEKDIPDEDARMALQMSSMWGGYIGESWEKQSLKFFWLEESIDGGNLFLASSYQKIVQRIARAALAKATILFNTKVKTVDTDQNIDGTPCVKVLTSKENHTFDEVLVTVPLGCLKRDTIAFSPPLSPRSQRAIRNIGYGRLEKVYITFPSAFWTKSETSSNSDSNDHEEPFPFFTHFLAPLYTPENPSHWGVAAISLASNPPFPADVNYPTLLFYIHGPCATHITSLVASLSPTSPIYYDVLNRFFSPYYTRLPNFSASDPDCKPSGILATEWQNDEFAGWGSYSNFQVTDDETVRLDEDIEALRYGEPERGLWFGGEHTAPFMALGTVTGAYLSGEAVGKRFLNEYGLCEDEEVKDAGEIKDVGVKPTRVS
ncbi:hypothetical protein MMC25_000420 [Agyrium rufum]|nr:hypothetical protein [Agyrium rufum]